MEYTMMELLPVVKQLSDRYTSKESGSVTYEMANQLMEAVIYCIEEYDREYGHEHAKDQIGQNQKAPVMEVLCDVVSKPGKPEARQAYDAGYALVLERAAQAKKLYDKIAKKFHAYGCTAYFDTVIKGMPSFFLYYDARFNPQNHILTLDYPVLISQEHLCGIDRILAYLHCVEAEQKFLGKFPEPLVRQVLSAHQPDYRDLFENLAGVMLGYCLGCMIAGKPLTSGQFEAADYEAMKRMADTMDRPELEEKLADYLKRIIKQGYGGDRLLREYLSACIPDFAAMLLHGAEHDCMEAVV